ncbi:MAG: DUF4294 domain-containing protein [Chitinophagales bacterium]|nr:DUF4294 domain-containing protein [Chitinophagales bacterium]
MRFRTIKYGLLLIFALLLRCTAAYAQPSGNDTLLLGGIVVDGVTYPMVFMDNVYVVDKMPRKWVRKRAKYDRLRHNVYKVYPYAVIAADVLKDVDSMLLAIGDDKRRRKDYLKSVELELRSRFKGELEDMTISQGHVLVKLIDRQTGKSCFNIVKELKGGVPAVVFQSIALIFSHNLKREYDATGEDRDIEQIVRELEANNSYEYQYRLQQSRLKVSRK